MNSFETIDLSSADLDLETLENGSALLGCVATATSGSSASCPATSASSFSSASSYA